MRAQRWQWTHTYGKHLLLASVVAVVLAGSGLVTVVTLGSGEEPPNPPPTTGPTPSPGPPPPSSAPTGEVLDAACVYGRWQAVGLVDESFTGTWTLIAGGPTYTFGENGNGVIDFDPEGGEGTTYEFREDIFGTTSNSTPTGERPFSFTVDGDGGRLLLTYQDLLGGAQMQGIPYVLGEDNYSTTCSAETMSMTGNDGSVELERID